MLKSKSKNSQKKSENQQSMTIHFQVSVNPQDTHAAC